MSRRPRDSGPAAEQEIARLVALPRCPRGAVLALAGTIGVNPALLRTAISVRRRRAGVPPGRVGTGRHLDGMTPQNRLAYWELRYLHRLSRDTALSALGVSP